MSKGVFSKHKMCPKNTKWGTCISRKSNLYKRKKELRSAFSRDYNRILHCSAFRRLKHKTQVFSAPSNDHICTRIEHINLVTSVSYTISNYLGLNTELTNAISIGHDLGHTPFGHAGEKILNEIAKEQIKDNFWHEKNSLRFIDYCETIEDPEGKHRNLNLTYAVRDGIICHCGEVDENGLFPRGKHVDLNKIKKPGEYLPYTWEGCVVKISDKIAYLGRDIEDAITLKILTTSQIKELIKIIRKYSKSKIKEINNTVVLHELITDLCHNSSPNKGIRLSDKGLEIMDSLKKFNYKNIYEHERLINYKEYSKLIMNSIFKKAKKFYAKKETIENVKKHFEFYPILTKTFKEWLLKFATPNERNSRKNKYENEILYDLSKEKDYLRAVIDFIAGMTDNFAIMIFKEITTF